ncbi:MAG: hypothetical protein KAQ81_09630, partial [Deltaproteobacteria bacterium]|nr:hypothetical protein [Deltaproteobacteria bacterium]
MTKDTCTIMREGRSFQLHLILAHQEISKQTILIFRSHPGMMTRHQYYSPYLVSPLCSLKFNTT